jgi:nicotinate-nucleotide pyrophosphorylase (carboxylating)
MDWHSRRLSAILEHALLEDRATSDATSRACIDAQQRATATVLAKQDCVLAGVGAVARILEIYEHLDHNVIGHPEVISHGEIFDGVRLHKGQAIAVVRHNARALLSCERVVLNVVQRLSGIATTPRRAFWIRAKPPLDFACWINMPCAAAAGRTTGSIFLTAC